MSENSDLIQKRYPLPTPEEENTEQALAILWQLRERHETARAILEATLREILGGEMLEVLIDKGLAVTASQGMVVTASQEIVAPLRTKGATTPLKTEGATIPQSSDILLTQEGERAARDIVRRHRLAERLFEDVLSLARDQIDPNACRMEHVISGDVEEAICTLLGHPQACPHGLAIPRGRCCEKALGQTGPIVFPLSALLSGQEGRVVYLSPQERPELHKLMAMGLVPAALLRVVQTSPAFVVSLGETLLALDPSLAQRIFVRKKNGESGRPGAAT